MVRLARADRAGLPDVSRPRADIDAIVAAATNEAAALRLHRRRRRRAHDLATSSEETRAARLGVLRRPAPLHRRRASPRRERRPRARSSFEPPTRRHTGAEAYNFFLTVSFSGRQVRILPYNRVVKELSGRSPEAFLEELAPAFSASRQALRASPGRPGEVRVYLGGRWIGIELPRSPGTNAIEQLDAALLERHVLDPLLGDSRHPNRQAHRLRRRNPRDPGARAARGFRRSRPRPSRCTRSRSRSSWRSPTPTRSCLPSPPGSSPSFATGC